MQNKENWFKGFGLSLVDFTPTENISLSIAGHFWKQPENLDFNTENAISGGALEIYFKYFSKISGS